MNMGSLNLAKLRKIASEPKEENAFAIASYAELTNIRQQLPDRICAAAGDSEHGMGKDSRFNLAFYQVSNRTFCGRF